MCTQWNDKNQVKPSALTNLHFDMKLAVIANDIPKSWLNETRPSKGAHIHSIIIPLCGAGMGGPQKKYLFFWDIPLALASIYYIHLSFFLIRFVGGAQRQNAVLFAHPRAFLLPKFAKLPKVAKLLPKNLSSVKYIFDQS